MIIMKLIVGVMMLAVTLMFISTLSSDPTMAQMISNAGWSWTLTIFLVLMGNVVILFFADTPQEVAKFGATGLLVIISSIMIFMLITTLENTSMLQQALATYGVWWQITKVIISIFIPFSVLMALTQTQIFRVLPPGLPPTLERR